MGIIYLNSQSTSDKEDGTIEHPYKTFKTVLDIANDGDTIVDTEKHVYKAGKTITKQKLKPINWSSLVSYTTDIKGYLYCKDIKL